MKIMLYFCNGINMVKEMNTRKTILAATLFAALLFAGCKRGAPQGNVEKTHGQNAEVEFPKPEIKIMAKTEAEKVVASALATYVDFHIEKINRYSGGDYDWQYLDTIFTKRLLHDYWDAVDKGIGLAVDPIMGIHDIGTRHLMSVETISHKGDSAIAIMSFGDLREDSIAVYKRKVSMAKDDGRWLIDGFITD